MAKQHRVRDGDSVASLAFEHGLAPKTIWNHPANRELKRKRTDPYVLFPGDVIAIPDKEAKIECGETERRHRFRRVGVPDRFKLRLLDAGGEPRADLPYVIVIDRDVREGRTDGDGRLEQIVAPNAREARLVLEGGEEYDLQLGWLDPISEITGVQGRLRSLGYYDGEIDGSFSQDLAGAIESFQAAANLDPTGRLDEATRTELLKQYGS